MDATTPLTPEAQRKQDRARKRKAILAGGVVLGLGAAVTLAAWSDDVFADGIFNTGTIELEGNVTATGSVANGTAGWASYDGPDAVPSGTTAGLAFAQPVQTLVPEVEVFAPIALRLSDASTISPDTFRLASVEITNGQDQLHTYLDYAAYVGVTAGNCATGDVTGATTTITGQISDQDGSATSLGTLTPATAAGSDQTVVPVCLGVELNSNDDAVKGAPDTQVTWRFTAATVD
ncbi:MAG: SipW-dependent-type signal peptide-containing protein [Dietzia maris]